MLPLRNVASLFLLLGSAQQSLGLFGGLVKAVDKVVVTVGDTTGNVVGTVGETTGNVVDTVGDTVEEVVDTVGDTVEDVVDTVGDTVEDIVDTVGDAVEVIIDTVLAPLAGNNNPDCLGRCSGFLGAVWGDLHFNTFDRRKFNFPASGEFTISKAEGLLDIQGRLGATSGPLDVSVLTGLALSYPAIESIPLIQASFAEFDSGVDTSIDILGGNCPAIHLYLDGNLQVAGLGDILSGSGYTISIDAGTIDIQLFDGVLASISLKIQVFGDQEHGCRLDAFVCLPLNVPGLLETATGLLGTPNGNSNDELLTLDIDAAINAQVLFDFCKENYCIAEADASLFVHEDANGGLSFEALIGCNAEFQESTDLSNPPDSILSICGEDRDCLLDGILGGSAAAALSLSIKADIDLIQSGTSLCIAPETCLGRCEGHVGAVLGDLHFNTFDGHNFALQASGEFTIAKAQGIFDIQGRLDATVGPLDVSALAGVALSYPAIKGLPVIQVSFAEYDSGLDTSVEILDGCPAIHVYLDGVLQEAGVGDVLSGPGFAISIDTEAIDIQLFVGDTATLSTQIQLFGDADHGCRMDTFVCLPSSVPGLLEKTLGLLGTPIGSSNDGLLGLTLDVDLDLEANAKALFNFAQTNYCIAEADASLFVHEDLFGGLSFDAIAGCDADFPGLIDLSLATDAIVNLCGTNKLCLMDGILGGSVAASVSLDLKSTIEDIQSGTAQCIAPEVSPDCLVLDSEGSEDQNKCEGYVGAIWGDLHFNTFDRRVFDLQARGEFTIAKAEGILDIQGRLDATVGPLDVSVLAGVAISYPAIPSIPLIQVGFAEFDSGLDTSIQVVNGCPAIHLYVDGALQAAGLGDVLSGTSFEVSVNAGTIDVELFVGQAATLALQIQVFGDQEHGCRMDTIVCLPSKVSGLLENVKGLLGTPIGLSNNGLLNLGLGLDLGLAVNAEALFDLSTSLYCIADAEASLFVHEDLQGGLSVDALIGGCNAEFPGLLELDLNLATDILLDICGGTDNKACLLDGVLGGPLAAKKAQYIQSIMNQIQKGSSSLCVNITLPDIFENEDEEMDDDEEEEDPCPEDVVLYHTDGLTPLLHTPFKVVNRKLDTIALEWKNSNFLESMNNVYVEYEGINRAYQCSSDPTLFSTSLELACPVGQTFVLVRITVSDDSLDINGDTASLNPCCLGDEEDGHPKVKYTFLLPCNSRCPSENDEDIGIDVGIDIEIPDIRNDPEDNNDNEAPDCLGQCQGYVGAVWGDLHFKTFDRRKFDLQANGEFTIAKAEGILDIQGRLNASAGPLDVSALAGVAIAYPAITSLPRIQVSFAEFDSGLSTSIDALHGCPAIHIYLDGVLQVAGLGDVLSGTGFEISIHAGTIDVDLFVGDLATVSLKIQLFGDAEHGCRMDTFLCLPSAVTGLLEKTVGLLGNPLGLSLDGLVDLDLNVGGLASVGLDVGVDVDVEVDLNLFQSFISNYCIADVSASLFAHEDQHGGLSVDALVGKCQNADFPALVDLSIATDVIVDLCKSDKACLLDGILGGSLAARVALDLQATIDAMQSSGSTSSSPLCLAPGPDCLGQCEGNVAAIWGDLLHFNTLDHRTFDLPSIRGEFTIAKAEGILDIQGRLNATAGPLDVSALTSVAISYPALASIPLIQIGFAEFDSGLDTSIHILDGCPAIHLYLDGALQVAGLGDILSDEGASYSISILETSGAIDVQLFDSNHLATVSAHIQLFGDEAHGCRLDTVLCLPSKVPGLLETTVGLLAGAGGVGGNSNSNSHGLLDVDLDLEFNAQALFDLYTSLYCIADVDASLFVHEDSQGGLSFDAIVGGCSAGFPGLLDLDLDVAASVLVDICGGSADAGTQKCLLDGLLGGALAAQAALNLQAQIDLLQFGSSQCLKDPSLSSSGIGINADVQLNLGLPLLGDNNANISAGLDLGVGLLDSSGSSSSGGLIDLNAAVGVGLNLPLLGGGGGGSRNLRGNNS